MPTGLLLRGLSASGEIRRAGQPRHRRRFFLFPTRENEEGRTKKSTYRYICDFGTLEGRQKARRTHHGPPSSRVKLPCPSQWRPSRLIHDGGRKRALPACRNRPDQTPCGRRAALGTDRQRLAIRCVWCVCMSYDPNQTLGHVPLAHPQRGPLHRPPWHDRIPDPPSCYPPTSYIRAIPRSSKTSPRAPPRGGRGCSSRPGAPADRGAPLGKPGTNRLSRCPGKTHSRAFGLRREDSESPGPLDALCRRQSSSFCRLLTDDGN